MANRGRPRLLSMPHRDEAERVRQLLEDRQTLYLSLVGRSNFVRKDQRTNCYFCVRRFTLFLHKQHCHGCGEVICSGCSRHRKVEPINSRRKSRNVRLCMDCIDKATASDDDKLHGNRGRESNNMIIESREKRSGTGETRTDSCAWMLTEMSTLSMGDNYDYFEESQVESSTSTSEDDQEMKNNDHDTLNIFNSETIATPPKSSPIEFLSKNQQDQLYEDRRQEIIDVYGVFDEGRSPKGYEALCDLACHALACEVAAVGFMRTHHQKLVASIGIGPSELPRNISFCSHLLNSSLPTVVLDTREDVRFSSNPLVTGSAQIRFYASTPVCDPGTGIIIGSVFVMDRQEKRELPPHAMEMLSYLSTAAERLLLAKKKEAVSSPEDRHSIATSLAQKPKSKHITHSRPHSSSDIRYLRGTASSERRLSSLESVPEHDFLSPVKPAEKLTRQSSLALEREQEAELERRRHTYSNSRYATKSRPIPKELLQLASCSNQPADSQLQSRYSAPMEATCLELLDKVTTTHQLLLRQQQVIFSTLSQHSARLTDIERVVGRLEVNLDDAMAEKKETDFQRRNSMGSIDLGNP